MSDVAFFSVVYPSCEKFLPDFLESLEHQSTRNFDLILINDGIAGLELASETFEIRILQSGGNPVRNRSMGIAFLKEEGYQTVIFGDCDDTFAINRVENSLQLLVDYDIVVNDLNLMTSTGDQYLSGYFSNRIEHGVGLRLENILDCNVFGLGNTAARVCRLPSIEIPSKIVAVDWFVFSLMLLDGASAVFSPETYTNYRQHENNIAGLQGISIDRLKMAAAVKASHYASLVELGLSEFERRARQYRSLLEKLDNDSLFARDYARQMLENCIPYPFWWESVTIPEEIN